MKVTTSLLVFALAGTADAFVGPSSASTRATTPCFAAVRTGPINGGPDGSLLVPSKYGQVNKDAPWGQRYPTYSKPDVLHAYEEGDFFGNNGPRNGGTNGSSLLPNAYEQVDKDHPFGGKNPNAIRTRPFFIPTYGGIFVPSKKTPETSKVKADPKALPYNSQSSTEEYKQTMPSTTTMGAPAKMQA